MPAEFLDRLLVCADCGGSFVFTAGEQIFFHAKQFKNDPKRCKPCKGKRFGAPAPVAGAEAANPLAGAQRSVPASLLSRETRTHCSECLIETTVPFRPTQGRPVLCRLCFQERSKAASNALTTTADVLPGAPPVTLAVGQTLGLGISPQQGPASQA